MIADESQPATEVAQTTAQMRATHKQDASFLRHGLDCLTAIIGSPMFVSLLSGAIFIWVVINLAAQWHGYGPFDPPPFAWLEVVAATSSLVIGALILTTQRREDRLADDRAHLILELTIANDQKIAKIIALLEESRRDNPQITNRVDDQAEAMATPSDTAAVLEAIKDIRDDVV